MARADIGRKVGFRRKGEMVSPQCRRNEDGLLVPL